MDSEVLQQLELIRVYVFVIMLALLIWAVLKTVESIQTIIIRFKETWDTSFQNKMEKLFDKGDYETIIVKCKEIIDEYPNHIDANWNIAKAYYYTNANDLSKKHFEKTAYLLPSWEENVSDYIDKLKNR